MTFERLATKLWVEALVRRAQLGGAAAFVLQTGDAERGDTLVKVARLNGTASLWRPGMGMDGGRVYQDLSRQGSGMDEAAVDAYVARARSRDTDLWVIEIEDREGRHFITDPVEENDEEVPPDIDLFKKGPW